MSSTPTIDLTVVDEYDIEGRIIRVKSDKRKTRYVLPSGARISMWEGGVNGLRSVLEVGGHKSITVRVVGDIDQIAKLYDFLT
jgi:hypothetical protein